jgi:hypothetical protein
MASGIVRRYPIATASKERPQRGLCAEAVLFWMPLGGYGTRCHYLRTSRQKKSTNGAKFDFSTEPTGPRRSGIPNFSGFESGAEQTLFALRDLILLCGTPYRRLGVRRRPQHCPPELGPFCFVKQRAPFFGSAAVPLCRRRNVSGSGRILRMALDHWVDYQ